MADENDKHDDITSDAMKFHPEQRDGEHAPRVFCSACGYPLTFLAEQRCPECGQAFDPNDPDTYHEIDDWVLLGMFGAGPEIKRAQETLAAAGIDSMLEFMPEGQNLAFYREQNHATQLLVHAGDLKAAQTALDAMERAAEPQETKSPTARGGCLMIAGIVVIGLILIAIALRASLQFS